MTTPAANAVREFHLNYLPVKGEAPAALAARIATDLRQRHAVVVRHLIYGAVAAHDEFLAALRREFGTVDWPITWVDGASTQVIDGVQIHAVAGANVRLLAYRDRIIGRIYDDGAARHCVLGDLGPTNLSASSPEQARETLENLETALTLAGMTMKDVARTWFYLDGILDWYGPFNKVRNDFFARHELRPNAFPASTGIGGRNPRGAALILGAWAMQPHSAAADFHSVPSPLQCSAPAYGSAFSRAVEITTPGARQLLISGTASIAPEGHTIHIGDTAKQITLTMQVVEAILRSRGLSWGDTTRATAYFRHTTDMPLFAAWLRHNGQTDLPVVFTRCDVCRDDLLFELELDAAVAGQE